MCFFLFYTIMATVAFSGIYTYCHKKNIPFFPDNIVYAPFYICSIFSYLFLCSIILIFTIVEQNQLFSYIFKMLDISSDLSAAILDSGLGLAVSLLFISILMHWCFHLINFILLKTIQEDFSKMLSQKEYTLLVVSSCIMLGIICFFLKLYKEAFSYLALIIGKYIWLDIYPLSSHIKQNTKERPIPIAFYVSLMFVLLLTLFYMLNYRQAFIFIAAVTLSLILSIIICNRNS